MTITHRLQPAVQVLEVRVQVPPVCLFGDTIHAHRSVLPLAVVCAFQGLHINEMRHGVKLSVGFTSRSYRYLQKSR